MNPHGVCLSTSLSCAVDTPPLHPLASAFHLTMGLKNIVYPSHHTHTHTGIIAEPIIRPLWRASCKEQSTVAATEIASNEDDTSDYYSLSGYSSPVSHSHSRSHSLCTEFLSCIEEEDRKSDHAPLIPFPLTSLEEELEELEMEEQLKQLELRRGSSEEAEPPSSSYRCVKLQNFMCLIIRY